MTRVFHNDQPPHIEVCAVKRSVANITIVSILGRQHDNVIHINPALFRRVRNCYDICWLFWGIICVHDRELHIKTMPVQALSCAKVHKYFV